jgi:hypothetical protein
VTVAARKLFQRSPNPGTKSQDAETKEQQIIVPEEKSCDNAQKGKLRTRIYRPVEHFGLNTIVADFVEPLAETSNFIET